MPKAKKLSLSHTEFSFPKITPIVYKTLSLDRVFTNLLPLIKYGDLNVAGDHKSRDIEYLVRHMVNDPVHFDGFSDHQDVVYRWVQSDFVDLINRGKKNEKVSAPIPLNLNTYKLRNSGETLDYGVAGQIFAMLYYYSPNALKALKDFLEQGTDPKTDRFNEHEDVDIDWLIIMRLLDGTSADEPDRSKRREILVPHCEGQAIILGDDILRLLAYKEEMPRRLLIENIKTLVTLHLTLYLLRLIRIIPYMVEHRLANPACSNCHVHSGGTDLFKGCPFQVDLVVDMGDDYHTPIAEVSRQSYLEQVLQHDQHIRAQLKLRKLYEFAMELDETDHKGRKDYTLFQLLELPGQEGPDEVRVFFRSRVQSLLLETADQDTSSGDVQDRYDPRLLAIRGLGLSDMDQYLEMLYLLRQNFLQAFFERMLDSLLQRNAEHGLLRSGFGRINSRKRFAMGSRLLEMFVHIGLLENNGDGAFRTRTLRLDEFIDWLESRYGFYTVRPPRTAAMEVPDLVAFRANSEQFTARMRKIGFYRTLSDAYISQIVQPRYRIDLPEERQ
jgi:hypothetical protein